MESEQQTKMTETQKQREITDKEIEDVYGKDINDFSFRNFLNCTIKENDLTDGELPDKDMTIINFEKFM